MALSRAAAVNRPLVEEATAVRLRMAELFGVPSWAHHRLRPRMARTPENVAAFYADLVPRLTTAGATQVAEMQALLEADLAAGRADGEPVMATTTGATTTRCSAARATGSTRGSSRSISRSTPCATACSR